MKTNTNFYQQKQSIDSIMHEIFKKEVLACDCILN